MQAKSRQLSGPSATGRTGSFARVLAEPPSGLTWEGARSRPGGVPCRFTRHRQADHDVDGLAAPGAVADAPRRPHAARSGRPAGPHPGFSSALSVLSRGIQKRRYKTVASSRTLRRGQRAAPGSASSAARTWRISSPGPTSRVTARTCGQVSRPYRVTMRVAPSLSSATPLSPKRCASCSNPSATRLARRWPRSWHEARRSG